MLRKTSWIRFIILSLLLFPFLASCAAAPIALLPIATSAYIALPGGLKVEKEHKQPLIDNATLCSIETVLVTQPEIYEALTENGSFKNIKLVNAHPQIRKDAVEIINKGDADAYLWVVTWGARTKRMNNIEYGRANYRLILANGESAYEQTVSISQRRGMLGEAPTVEEINGYLLKTFIDDLKENSS